MNMSQKALDKLKEFGYSPNDYEMKSLYVYSADNLGRMMGDEYLVLIPKFEGEKEIANQTDYVTLNGDVSEITCYNIQHQDIYKTTHENYKDYKKPRMFILEKLIKMTRDNFIGLKEELGLSNEQVAKLLSKPTNMDTDEKIEILRSYGLEKEEIDKLLGIGMYYQLEEKKKRIAEILNSGYISAKEIDELDRKLMKALSEKNLKKAFASNDVEKIFDGILFYAANTFK